MSDHQDSRRCYVCLECRTGVEAEAVARERAAIVAWLRESAEIQALDHNIRPDDTGVYWSALAIERGEHLAGDDE